VLELDVAFVARTIAAGLYLGVLLQNVTLLSVSCCPIAWQGETERYNMFLAASHIHFGDHSRDGMAPTTRGLPRDFFMPFKNGGQTG
jgi:hypothetical protein